ncbi:MAG: SDR family oxidoreductase [Cenarchaeum sp. SB0661_bin_35]|nr:SDR family oxidoreductase [Cenarchaeum sp. SB0667_bin_13]MXY37391.1 SDR family oxidoreductase [Cenarchaeum sp. SB0664_bin_35]MXZ92967.1 SDR family oxidoreductase [Cenarchaeum sp. SB0666_bin_15]MYB46589.1 SDR family oxidoreductase [Cenarchaeum sp. SB0662_bin_33]MYC79045.1 SDR family oxidoreductase [Cenarchaeum sp. SB0661_bin_35]MYD58809.1 SDR family oxidoreductase [Cenarchaeum sp. SB0678_bin_8]MYI52109.1 SDR family oxidoreductase [Cenarchaeum sp. SB0673_bin_9]MYJ28379.1 SDR family oxidored
MKAIVMGGTRGIGDAISDSLRRQSHDVISVGHHDINTSDLDSVRRFIHNNPQTDILVLNTGGPPPKKFTDVTEQEWLKYHNQLFLSFVLILQGIKVNRGGYIFLISSSVVKEPNSNLAISSAYRAAFVEIFKLASRELATHDISCINIAPGLISTDRTLEIMKDMEADISSLPMGRMGKPSEIGDFVGAIVEREIKYLSGVTVTFDGASSVHVF